MNERVSFARPDCGDEEAEAAADVIRSGWIVGGPKLRDFEAKLADYCGMAEGIGVSSWTTGAFLVLHALGVGPGDEVIVPSLSFIATANVVAHTGATPVFADVDPATWNIDPADVAKRITSRTKAIIPVDQAGLPCEIGGINALAKAHDLFVFQDCACAIGSRYHGRPVGGLCHVSAFSFHARKVLTTAEGGMILTDDRRLAERLRTLRHQGMSLSDFQRFDASPTTYEHYDEIGFNFRMTDIQAAIGLVQFAKLDSMLARRRAVAERYNEALANHPLFQLPHVSDGMSPNWQSYWVAVRRSAPVAREHLMETLYERGIPTRRGVMASHLEPAYRNLRTSLPHTEDIAERSFMLPMHSGLTPQQQGRVLTEIVQVSRQAMDGVE
jgi:perosamine synthetase